jgi:hypothetical protein
VGSDLVLAAMKDVSNRYLLARISAKATRKIHRPYRRIVKTFNDVLARFNDRINLTHGEGSHVLKFSFEAEALGVAARSLLRRNV